MAKQSTQNPLPVNTAKGYLVDVDGAGVLEFDYAPSDIEEALAVNYAEAAIPGLEAPRLQYVSGGSRKFAFTADFYSEKVREKVDWIRDLCKPTRTGTMLQQAPHKVMLLFAGYNGIVCVIRQVKIRYFYLFDPQTGEPKRATVNLSVQEAT